MGGRCSSHCSDTLKLKRCRGFLFCSFRSPSQCMQQYINHFHLGIMRGGPAAAAAAAARLGAHREMAMTERDASCHLGEGSDSRHIVHWNILPAALLSST